jgi:hypothetical protein
VAQYKRDASQAGGPNDHADTERLNHCLPQASLINSRDYTAEKAIYAAHNKKSCEEFLSIDQL